MEDWPQIEISVVISTYNRKQRLLSLLHNLSGSSLTVKEVIIADAGNDNLSASEMVSFTKFPIICIYPAAASVCVQRNAAVAQAKSAWVFICDDDIEVPAGYLEKLAKHITTTKQVVAVSGNVLHLQNQQWLPYFTERSGRKLLWKYFFGLSIWGTIEVKQNWITKRITSSYKKKSNYIAKTGWPVISDFSGSYFTVPTYGLGAAVIKREWLLQIKYDEVLDPNGIGDNYGLAIHFPPQSIHIVNDAFVFHHKETAHRLNPSLQFYRRILALDYFRQINNNINHVKKRWLLWSLTGCMLQFIITGNKPLIKACRKLIVKIVFNKNEYVLAAAQNKKIITPVI
jgi:glycosyltransferase involved in cell wall biosynthesis